MSETPERMLLSEDAIKRQKHRNEIDKQHAAVQIAVDAFNTLPMKPLAADELQYLLRGGANFMNVRWRDEQQVPEGWPQNLSREKFIDMLQPPDFGKAAAACARCNMLAVGLFTLQGDKVFVNDEIAEAYVYQDNVYLVGEEIHRLTKLKGDVKVAG